MTKRRIPLTFDAALARIVGQLENGWSDAAAIADRKERTVRNWGDPDSPEEAPGGAMLRLDLAYQAAGGLGAPFFEAYAAQLELAEASRFAQRHQLLAHAEKLIREGGEGHAALIRACQPGASEADQARAFRELGEALEQYRPVLALLGASSISGSPALSTGHVDPPP